MAGRRVVLVPLDPVHDVGLKLIKHGLDKAGHRTSLLAPDLPLEEAIEAIAAERPDLVLVSRTLGYGVAELLGRFVDLADAAGIREYAKLALGGMAVRPELASELGFDAGFGPGTTVEEAVAYVEGRPCAAPGVTVPRRRPAIGRGYSYDYRHGEIGELLDTIAAQFLDWAAGHTSPGVERARLRERLLDGGEAGADYAALCDPEVAAGNAPHTRVLSPAELRQAVEEMTWTPVAEGTSLRGPGGPLVFSQYGTGCPLMDIAHIRILQSWGADGVIHFDPSWGARREGLHSGHLSHSEDGTPITLENLTLLAKGIGAGSLWQVRAHRGLNTAETVVLAAHTGAHLTKINPIYGALGGGTDPARILVDSVEAIRQAARHDLPFDIVTNEELCGIPAHKAFAGMLCVMTTARRLGAVPILQPLFCMSPAVLIGGQMRDNYVDYNAAKLMALRGIVDAPVWPGAPVGFMTHTEDRVQSSLTTALHALLASSLRADGVTIASADEAYAGGPISAAARIDTLRATAEAFRFLGKAGITPTGQAAAWADELVEGILAVLRVVAGRGCLADSLYAGDFGTREDGANPGRAGRGTVKRAAQVA